MIFKDLDNWAITRQFLHRTSQVLSAVPRAFAPHHDRWWHISLKIRADGWWLTPFTLPDGAVLRLGLRTADHTVVLEAGSARQASWDLKRVKSPGDLAVALYAETAGLGLTGLAPDRFLENGPSDYDSKKASQYFDLIEEIDRIFKRRRARLPGSAGPVQLWPHGFDLAFEWVGGREVEIESDGAVRTAPAQLNLGWSPGEETHPAPYFYSNPWPFDENFKRHPLPEGARWFDDGWQGSIFPYSNLVGDPAAEKRLLDFAETVFDLAYPTLTGP